MSPLLLLRRTVLPALETAVACTATLWLAAGAPVWWWYVFAMCLLSPLLMLRTHYSTRLAHALFRRYIRLWPLRHAPLFCTADATRVGHCTPPPHWSDARP